jgi:MFS family permease
MFSTGRISMTSNSKFLWTIGFHHFCNDGTLMVLVALIPVLLVEMKLSYYDVGFLGLSIAITVVAQLVVGKYVDRKFSTYMLEAGAGLMALSFFLLLFVTDFDGLLLAIVAMRVGAAFYHPVGISWVTRAYNGAGLDDALGVQSGLGNLGVILAFGSSGFLAELAGWKLPCMIWAVLNVSAVALGLLIIRGHHKSLVSNASTKDVRFMHTMKTIGILAVPILAGGALYQVTSYFGPLNLTKHAQWTAGEADLMFAVWIGVGTVTSYMFGRFSERLGRRKLLRLGYLLSAVSALLIAFVSSWFLVAIVLIVYGALLFLTYPALFALLSEVTSEGERGTGFGILFGFQLGGGAVVVYICGIVAEALSDPAYALVLVSGIAASALVALSVWESGQASDMID